MKELKRLEDKLNKKFQSNEVTVKLGFAPKEITTQNLDHVFVRLKHPYIVDHSSIALFKSINSFKSIKILFLKIKIERHIKRYLKDWLH